MQALWFLLDIVLGVLVAGLIVPIAIITLPDAAGGRATVLGIVVVCILAMSIFRRLFVTMPGTRQNDGE